jgi:type IV pilus assembly protein PilN
VKPIHLNLAARPYRDYRPVYAVVVAMSLLAAFLMLNNVDTYLRYIRETKSTRAKIADIEAQGQRERQLADAAQNRIRNLDLARLDRQTNFINAKLAERAFSWSALLDELESVLANDVRLITISPTFGADGVVKLDMSFQSKSSDGMLTTIKRMQNDPQFKDPFPSVENQIEGGYAFRLTAGYIPPPIKSGGTEVIRASEVKR